MEHLHSIEGYVFVFSFPLAVAFTQISKKVLPRHYKVPSLQDSWELVVAGGLSHFFLETLFEENGNTELYRLIISTGSFESNEIPPLTIVLVGSVCVLVVYIFLKGFARNEKNTTHQAQLVMRNLLRLSLVYILYCAVSKFMFSRSPVGEEADLGVLLFLGVFHFLPIYLCFRCAARHRRGVIHDNEQQHEQSALYCCLETGSSMTSPEAWTSSIKTPAPPIGAASFPLGWMKQMSCPEAPLRMPPGVNRTPCSSSHAYALGKSSTHKPMWFRDGWWTRQTRRTSKIR